ncbi:MAG: tyrosine-type recombinase/integrase [Conexibacter sp.]|nr:tyrosine-type recombinase/integrase [Conexibacter sp.]
MSTTEPTGTASSRHDGQIARSSVPDITPVSFNETETTSAASPADGKSRDARKLVKTGTPGIFRRQSADGTMGSYVVIYRAGGKQRKEYAKTLSEARKIKAARTADDARGEFQERTTIKLREFLTEWIDRYQGTGRRGFRDGTREEYRRLLDQYAHAYFSERLRLVDVTPRTLAQYVAWLADEGKQRKRLADTTIRNAVVPVRAALATAEREGLLRHNPARGLALPHRPSIDDDEQQVKALSREQLAAFLSMVPDRHSLLVELVASTGVRISEAIALQRRHLVLDGSRPHAKIRRAIVKRRVEPPKTRHGKRNVPLAPPLAAKLRVHLADLPDASDVLVFASLRGTPLDPDNLRSRMLKPLYEEVGAPWAGWHTLRHTFASVQLARGVNVVALSRVLGHHSAAFTLDTYVHLLEGDEAPALDLEGVVGRHPSVHVSALPVGFR